MNDFWKSALWIQFGAAIDMLENAIRACPAELWSDNSKPPTWPADDVPGFWYVAYHALFFPDYNLAESPADFAPPPPFDLRELDPAGLLPDRP